MAGLSYAKMREVALARAHQATALPDGRPLTSLPLPEWSGLHAPLPLGFLAAPTLAPLCVGGRSATVDLTDASRMLSEAMAAEVANRMVAAEPERWAEEGADGLVTRLGLVRVTRVSLTRAASMAVLAAKVPCCSS